MVSGQDIHLDLAACRKPFSRTPGFVIAQDFSHIQQNAFSQFFLKVRSMNSFLNWKIAPRGAALIEYGLLVGLVAVVAIGGVIATGQEVESTFSSARGTLSDNVTAASGGNGLPGDSSEATAATFDSYKYNWTFVAGQNGDIHGVYSSSFGTRTSAGPEAPYLRQMSERPSDIRLIVDGDHFAEVQGLELACSNDQRLPVSGADINYYYAAGDHTRVYWYKPGYEFDLVPGVEYACALIPTGAPDPQ
jgi:Flp pilus assembly pilin Flp